MTVCTVCNKRAVSGDDLDLADPLNVKDRGTEASYIQSGAGRFDTRIDGLGNGEIQLSRLSIWLEMGIGKHVKIYCRILRVPFPPVFTQKAPRRATDAGRFPPR